MFWQASNYSQPSPIEQILEKENYTLEELLDEDDLIQETKSLNGRLIEYLKQPETVSKLLAYVVEPYEKGMLHISCLYIWESKHGNLDLMFSVACSIAKDSLAAFSRSQASFQIPLCRMRSLLLRGGVHLFYTAGG